MNQLFKDASSFFLNALKGILWYYAALTQFQVRHIDNCQGRAKKHII